jgi:hypothetical protein
VDWKRHTDPYWSPSPGYRQGWPGPRQERPGQTPRPDPGGRHRGRGERRH